jgi:hypothetical protein
MIELFPCCFLLKGDDHRHFHIRFVIFRHWNYLVRLFYSIENTVVIPVNLKLGYESTVLCRDETRENRGSTEGQTYLVHDTLLISPFVSLSLPQNTQSRGYTSQTRSISRT